MTRLCTIIGVLMLVASPALAQPFHHHGLDRPHLGPDGIEISAKRAQALRECNAIMAQYPEYLWGNMASFQYRACMTEHGEVE